MKYFYHYSTRIGGVCLVEENGAITHLMLAGKEKLRGRDAAVISRDDSRQEETALIRGAYEQLEEYLSGRRKAFELTLCPAGTDFQKKVWKALQRIPYGETRSYKEIAAACGNEKACRAVGLANNRNPIAIFIPCHRVIGADGGLVGYGGGLDIKKELLALEKNRAEEAGGTPAQARS